MQDNNKDILADKGWQSMELILDKEMPQKKKRRFFLWWLFGGLFLLSVLYYFSYSEMPAKGLKLVAVESINEKPAAEKSRGDHSNDVKESVKIETDAKPIIPNRKILNSKSGTTIIAAKEDLVVNIDGANIKHEKVPVDNNFKLKIISKIIPKKASTGNDLSGSVISNISTLEIRPDVVGENSGIEVESLNRKGSRIFPQEQQSILKENLIDKGFEAIVEEPFIEMLLIEIKELSRFRVIGPVGYERELSTPITRSIRNNYWYGDIGGSLNWGLGVNLYGLNTSANFGHSFGGNFDLGFSFGLGSFRYSAATNSLTDINTGSRATVSIGEAENVLNSSFRNASYFELGMHTSQRLTKRFKVSASAGYMHIFSSIFNQSSDPFLGLGNSAADSAGPTEVADVDVEFGGFEKTEFVYQLNRKWFPYAGISTQFGINEKFGISLSYRKVFGKLFESSANPLSMDRIELGAKYRFMKTPNRP